MFMEKTEIIKNIALRSGGDIYLGVVGAVRTGKSTFIKRMVETLVVPYIEDEYEKKRTLDEIPQSAQGKTIMTTEPKFIPNQAAKVNIDDFSCNIRLVDCVGYVIPNAKGASDDNGPRMVKTPWYDEEIPFVEAAEVGTEKVIKDHSTIGIVVTTDGSIGEFNRSDYLEAEERVIEELKAIGKPFIVVLNTTHPTLPETERLAESIKEAHNVPVLPINVDQMNEREMISILREALYEFPVLEVKVNMPEWIAILNANNDIKRKYIDVIRESVMEVDKLRDIEKITEHFRSNEVIEKAYLSDVDPSTGIVTINLEAPSSLYSDVLRDIIKIDVTSKAGLLSLFQDYEEARREYDQIKYALKMVKQTGYGIVEPRREDLELGEPEIIKQGNRFGVKIKASAPSLHIMRVDVETEVTPLVGTEDQSQDLAKNLVEQFENDPEAIWDTNILGKSLFSLVGDNINSKIVMMPVEAQRKMRKTLARIVNEGKGGVLCILL